MTQEMSLYTARTLDDTMTLGKVLAQSGYFADSREAAQAVVKILAGQELGFGPIASMTGVNIIKGKVTLSANLIASAIKRSGRYNYRVVTLTDEVCRIDFYEANERIGTSEFTMQNAKDAGLATGDNWRKFSRNMLFARAISNGAKWYCPDLSGGPIYTPEELGATVDGETGEVIDAPRTITVEKPSAGPPWPQPDPVTAANDDAFERLPSASAERAGGNGKTTPPATKHEPPAQRPWSAPDTIAMIRAKAEYNTKREVGVQVADGKLGALIGLMDSKPWNTDARHGFLHSVFGNASTRQLTDAQRAALVQWANPMKTGSEKEAPWAWDANAQQEYAAVVLTLIDPTTGADWYAMDDAIVGDTHDEVAKF